MIRDLVCGRGQVHATRIGHAVVDEAFDCGTDTRFCFFSAGKPVTATAVHLLVADGVLSYDDPIARWVPEFGSHGKDLVTVHHVLLHQGGFPDADMSRVPPGSDALPAICDMPLEFEPGSRCVYHPLTGYAILAEVVARASGTSFPDLCARRIFGPLDMDRTTWG
ncbi:MAG TPA: serine hydrolase domain-containing protein, partial [Nitriliruptorales bacterium]